MSYIYIYLPSHGIPIPALQTHLHQVEESLTPVSPLTGKLPSCWVITLERRKRPQQPPCMDSTCTHLQTQHETLMFDYRVIWIEHHKILCGFPCFGQNY